MHFMDTSGNEKPAVRLVGSAASWSDGTFGNIFVFAGENIFHQLHGHVMDSEDQIC